MRNVFHQYTQPENQLTHALACTLGEDRGLIRPFLRWLGLKGVPKTSELRIVEQQVPGELVSEFDEDEAMGLPDLCVFTDAGWAAVFECKVQAAIGDDQIRRHQRTAVRYGFETPHMFVLCVDEPSNATRKLATVQSWREVYAWFRAQRDRSDWARRFTDYMEVFEVRMLAKGYGIRGTITMFDGLKFDENDPYTYAEAKRLIRLLRSDLVNRKDLFRLGVDPKATGRGAITGRTGTAVWDYLSFRAAGKDAAFTSYPHLTLDISQKRPSAMLTIPNGVRGGLRTKLRASKYEAFEAALAKVEKNLRPIVKRSKHSAPRIYAVQRHYPSQRSASIEDAALSADLRTAFGPKVKGGPKHQPQWIKALYETLAHKHSNIQFGLGVHFDYRCPIVRSPEAADLFAEAWVQLKPMLDYVTAEG